MPKFIIEARNQLYQRVGLVENYASFEAILRHNAPGTWTVTLPANAPEVDLLNPGCGVIVRIEGQEDVAMSGPITSISHEWDSSNQGAGTTTVSGVTDDQLLFERVTYPTPEEDLENQTDERHIFLGNARVLLEFLVDWNCGPAALGERQYPELDIDTSGPALGTPAAVSTRFDVLGEKLQELANAQGLGFRVRQNSADDRLTFKVFQPQDKRDIVFSRSQGNLQAYSYDIESPSATRVIFGCQGEGKDRYFQDTDFSTGALARWDDRDSRIEYSGSWVEFDDASAYKGTTTRSTITGDEFTLTFTGTGIRLVGMREDNDFAGGYYYLDDGESVFFSMTGVPAETPGQVLLDLRGIPYGSHTFRFEGTYWAWIDYIEILDEQLVSGAEWRHRGERFYDRRDIPVAWDPTHTTLIDPSNNDLPADESVYLPLLEQAVIEAWDEVGAKGSLSLTPIDTEVSTYGRDYRLGDVVTVEVNGSAITDVLREVRLSDGEEGPRVTPTIGNSQASSTPGLYTTIRRLWSRLRRLEAQ